MRRQMVSMRRMQAIAPEVKEIQRRFKGDRVKQQQATMALYKERGISQAGCLVALLPLLLILPMYQVVSEGLRASDLIRVAPGLRVPARPAHLPEPADAPAVHRLDDPVAGRHARERPRGLIPLPITIPILNLAGISIFALFYTGLQLVASRMALPPHDPEHAARRRTRAPSARSPSGCR